MPKKTRENFIDIVPASGKRVISDVVSAPKKEITSQFFKEPLPTIKFSKQTGRRWKKGRAVFIALTVLIFFISGSMFFAKMEVALAPKTASWRIEKTLILKRTGEKAFPVFRTLALPDARSGSFNATEKRTDDAKAGGIAVIFNKSKDAQVLIASTRLEAPNGNIYRIPKTIVVPAAKSESGELVPGSKEVAVLADKPGSAYNLGLADFTLPGLKGGTKYELIFGRSKTEMSGGSEGAQTVIGKNDRDTALAGLIEEAKKEAVSLILEKIPREEFLLQASIEYAALKEESVPAAGAVSDNFTFNLEGEIRAATMSRSELETALLKDSPQLAGFGGAMVRIKNLENLDIKLINYKFDATSFTIQVSGEAEAEAVLDQTAVKNKIIEKGISSASALLGEYPYISRAEISFKPFWIGLFYKKPPTDPARIDIVLKGS
ncbi:MAG: hypothetical protein Q8Q46_00245 [Candidatus Giovannonibacteria bacterium]|nr:hypothetical protein [Candidatus Giovannonibacteria bacterium]